MDFFKTLPIFRHLDNYNFEASKKIKIDSVAMETAKNVKWLISSILCRFQGEKWQTLRLRTALTKKQLHITDLYYYLASF